MTTRAGHKIATPTLDSILATKTLEAAIADGDVLTIRGVAQKYGYHEGHVRKLCGEGKLRHAVRGGHKIFILPADAAVLTQTIDAKKSL